MKIAEIPLNEKERILELLKYEILDTPEEEEFDNIVKLASQICKVPISLISLVDEERQWFKSKIGLPLRELSRDSAFCAHALLQEKIMVVNDTEEDQRFFDNPLVTGDPHIRFYAGAPLITSDGMRLGTLCVIDSVPRQLDENQLFALGVLSDSVMKLMQLRLNNKQLSSSLNLLNNKNEELEKLNNLSNKIVSIIGHDLRSPFHTLSGLVKLLEHEESLPPEELKVVLDKIKIVLNTSEDLLVNLVNWGQNQIANKNASFTDINLHEVVEEVKSEQKIRAKQKNNKITNLVDDINIIHDKNALKFILRNIVQNANKFTQHGSITISSVMNKDNIVVSVADTGVGMPKDKLKTLFSEKQTTKGTGGEGGTGFGMIMCKEFVEKYNGQIWVESQEGIGTAFYFSIVAQG